MRSPHIARQPVVLGPSSGSARTLYDGTMIAIAIFAATLIIMPEKPAWTDAAHVAVWAVFATDYLTRLALSTDRRAFLRRNIIEGVAALPLDLLQVARTLRLVSVIRILRPAAALARVGRDLRAIGATNGLSWALLATLIISVVGAFTIRLLEPDIASFPDALWWAVVTATTVGYGDLAPVTAAGRGVAVVLMLAGIGAIGMMTASVATYFLTGDKAPPHIAHIRNMLLRWDELSPADRAATAALLWQLVADDGPAGPEGEAGRASP